MRLITIFILFLISSAVFSQNNNKEEFLYSCPSYNDIKYINGQFTATTNYNGLKTDWFSVQSFPEASVDVIFIRANMGNECIGGLCEIECVYKPNSRAGGYVFLEVPFQAYVFSHVGSGEWHGNICENSIPSACEFYMVKDPI
ncbi:MAG: DUF3757 domain-containing protein [Gammaproteobacteria bacterium]